MIVFLFISNCYFIGNFEYFLFWCLFFLSFFLRLEMFIELVVMFLLFNLCSGLVSREQNVYKGMIKIFVVMVSLVRCPIIRAWALRTLQNEKLKRVSTRRQTIGTAGIENRKNLRRYKVLSQRFASLWSDFSNTTFTQNTQMEQSFRPSESKNP